MIGILHIWSRTLAYHPHAHFIVTGGGWFEDENIWLPCKENFLVPIKALSKIFRAKFRDYLRTKDPAIFTTINQKVWKDKWVVHSQAVGSGEDALKYLSQMSSTRCIYKKKKQTSMFGLLYEGTPGKRKNDSCNSDFPTIGLKKSMELYDQNAIIGMM